MVSVAAELSREDLLVREGAGEESRIASEVGFEQIEAAPVDGEGWRVRQHDPVCGKLETFVLPPHFAAIALEQHRDRGQPVPVRIAQLGAEIQQELESLRILRFAR